jgi:hypothetical protein
MSNAVREHTSRLIGLKSPWRIALPLLLAFAFLYRLSAVLYGLPQQLDPDERISVEAATRMVADRSLDPQWCGAPASTLITILGILYSAIAAGGLLFGFFGSLADLGAFYDADVAVFFVVGRMVSVISGTLCVFFAYVLATRFVGKPWATSLPTNRPFDTAVGI